MVMMWSFSSMIFFRGIMVPVAVTFFGAGLYGIWIIMFADVVLQALIFARLHFKGDWVKTEVQLRRLVPHEIRDLKKERVELFADVCGNLGVLHGGVHQSYPSVAFGLANGEADVAHAEPRMASFLDVGVGAAEAEDEKVAQPFF